MFPGCPDIPVPDAAGPSSLTGIPFFSMNFLALAIEVSVKW